MPSRAIAAGLAVLTFLLGRAEPALAHLVSADVGDFYAGLLHPLTSWEHLLPLAGLAFLAAQSGRGGGRLAVCLLPLALVVGVCGGALWPLPRAAAGLAGLWLAVCGVLAAWPGPCRPALVGLCAAGLGVALGWRGGADWAVSRAGWQFVPGVAACGFLLTALGAAWLPRLEGGWRGKARGALGLALTLAGLLLAFRGVMGEGGAAGLGQFAGWLDGGRVGDFLKQPTASPWTLAGVLAGAMAWGGVHALTPGHGKALVGAYLVGARGTWRHAVWLGLTVAVTHTAGVFLLGGAAVLAADEAGRERMLPWLALASGLGMCAVGGTMAARGLWRLSGRAGEERAHSHGGLTHSHGGLPHSHGGTSHSHGGVAGGQDEALHNHGGPAHSHGGGTYSQVGGTSEPVGWRNLLALGVAGGLVPCPSALALMLAAIALGRPGLGLVLCAAFGLGLAGVLTGVGLLCLAGVRFLGDSGRLGRAAHWLPLVGAGLIAAIGALAAWEALAVLIS